MTRSNRRALDASAGNVQDFLNPTGLNLDDLHECLLLDSFGPSGSLVRPRRRNLTDSSTSPTDAPPPVGDGQAMRQIRKPDGSIVEIREGYVSSVRNGSDSIQYEYVRDNGRIRLDGNGNPVLASVTTNVNGVVNVIDLANDPELQARMHVSQSGGSIGDLVTVSIDGRSQRILRTDFSEVDQEFVTHNGRTVPRTMHVRNRDGSTTSYAYDSRDPTRIMSFTETFTTAFGETRTVQSDRVGDSNNFVSRTVNGTDVTYRTGVNVDEQGRLAFRELRENWFSGPSEYDGASLQAAREQFLATALSHGVFRGNEQEIRRWMDKFEQRIRRIREQHPDWRLASDAEMAESYSNLARIFTDTPTGIAARVTQGERRRAVEDALRELADPIAFINQGPLGTCYLNHCEDATVQRLPQHFTRVLRQVLTTGQFTSLGVDRNGQHRVVSLSEAQLHYVPTYHRTYSNQLFQFAAMAALGYRSPYQFPGTTTSEANYVKRLIMGRDAPNTEHNTWVGPWRSRTQILRSLQDGVVAYIIPGHAMSIVDYDPVRNRYLVNNWWGGSGDGWYSPERIGIRG